MAKGEPAPADAADLRRRAEDQLCERGNRVAPCSAGDTLRLLHELEVHQVELEMQNEELRASRHEAEQAAAGYAELYDFAPMGYATLAGDGNIISINFAGARLLGVERARLKGLRFAVFVAERDRAAFADFLQELLLREFDDERAVCELALHGEDLRHARLTGALLARPALEILLAIENVTERRRQEDDLKEAMRILNASQRAARLGTFVMDVETGTWTSSAALDEILGIDKCFQRTAEGWLTLIHPDDRDAMAALLPSALRGDALLDREYRVVRRSSGEVCWAWILGDLQHDDSKPCRLVGTIQDVTERRRLLQERGELLRAAEVARARAEAANRAKDAFMAALSHELRNPLAPISNSLFVLEKAEPGSERARRATSVIGRQVRHLSRLVDDLLDVTRITRGKIQIQRRRLDLNEVARVMVDDHGSLFDRSGVRLELTLAPAPVVVDGDWDRLAQVVGNLLQNSAKFCQRGGVTRVAVSEARGERRAIIRVADDGAGMEHDMLSRLFEPFTQADMTLDRSKGGLGLGMAVAKGLVDLHGGEISAHSGGLGEGAEFVVRLPLASETVAAAGDAHHCAPLAHRRVLIIEDNVDAADSLRELLELHLHQAAVAYNGPDGIAKARDFHPDIVLCDIGLPGMDGYEVAAAFRSDEELRGAYLVALSGYAQPEDLRRAEESGFQRHVAKPPDPGELERLFAEAPGR
jgi:PAS domain S-box-containing protein